MDKKSLSERDICTKFITPAILKADWVSQNHLEKLVNNIKLLHLPLIINHILTR